MLRDLVSLLNIEPYEEYLERQRDNNSKKPSNCFFNRRLNSQRRVPSRKDLLEKNGGGIPICKGIRASERSHTITSETEESKTAPPEPIG